VKVLVVYTKTFLTGPFTGKVQNAHIVCNSHASAKQTVKELREHRVDAGEFSGDLFKVSKIRRIPFSRALTIGA
jgi:hypothetical protein